MPRSYWAEIKKAEAETEQGNKKYTELMNLFKKEYASNNLAVD
jgi:hypothetical protein|tara:strand:+ start:368 stop:496 length:129 start_codon:yes stop_codon:yes gene_type:complete